MKIIGITGGVGAGKTQILEYLNNKYGATICMADEVGKKLQKKEQNALMKLLHISERKFWMKKESWTGQSFQTLFLPTGLNFCTEWDCTSKSKRRNSEEDCKRRTQKYESDAD